MGKAKADEYGIEFVETSAKQDINVQTAFKSLVSNILKRYGRLAGNGVFGHQVRKILVKSRATPITLLLTVVLKFSTISPEIVTVDIHSSFLYCY